MICPNCQANLPDGSKFCTNCGADVKVKMTPQQAPQQPPMQYRQEAPAQQPVQQQQAPHPVPATGGDKSRKGLIAALVAVGVALAAVVVVLVLLFTGVIGGGVQQPSVDPGPQVISGITGITGTEPDIDVTDEPDIFVTDEPMPEPEGDAPQRLKITTDLRQAMYTDTPIAGEMELLRISCETMTIEDGSSAIQSFAKMFDEVQEDNIRNRVLSNAQDVYASVTDHPQSWYGTWYHDSKLLFDRADTQVLSFVNMQDAYFGGAHGSFWFSPFNIDAETGQDIAFADIVKDHEALAEAMFAEMKKSEDFAHVCEYYENDAEESFAEYIQKYTLTDAEGGLLCWTLAPEGFHVWFGDYDLGSYAMGTGDIIIPYESYPEVFHENAYITQKNVPTVVLQQTATGTEPPRRNLTEYCVQEAGFMPAALCAWSGVYVSGDGRLEITPYGTYEVYENGTAVSEGVLRDTPPAMLLFEGSFEMDISKNVYGQLLELPDQGEGVVGLTTGEGDTEMYTYDADASAEKGYIRRKPGPIDITEEQMESLWSDGYNVERSMQLYAWRGEFETKDADGKPVTGDVIYNGDENRPVYTLRTADGTDYAEIVFLDGSGLDEDADPVMWITYLQEEKRTGLLYRAKG